MENNKLEQWKKEVETYLDDLNKKLLKSEKAKELYYGFEVMDGGLKMNPEILFIGINPGEGNGEKHHKVKFYPENYKDRISYLDVFNDDYRDDYPNGYHLAEKTINFFKLMGWDNDKIKSFFENKVCKSNFYYIATKSSKEISQASKCIGLDGEYFNKSAYFTIQLIKTLKPKIVILEGKQVFDNIVEECYEKSAWSEPDQFGYFYDEQEKIHLIGYTRRGFTNENRSKFINKLKEIL